MRPRRTSICSTALAIVSLLLPFNAAVYATTASTHHTIQKNQRDSAEQLNTEGKKHYQQRQFQQALESYQRALKIAQETDNQEEEATALHNIGDVYQAQRQLSEALDFYQQALAIRKQLNRLSRTGVTLLDIGSVQTALKQYQEALNSCQQALTLFRDNKDRRGEVVATMRLGEIHAQMNQFNAAVSFFQQAFTIADVLEEATFAKAHLLLRIADVYKKQKQYPKALEKYQQTLKYLEEHPQKIEPQEREDIKARVFRNIGAIYYEQANYTQALEIYQQSLIGARKGKNRNLEAEVLVEMGTVHQDRSDYLKALKAYQRALKIQMELENKSRMGIIVLRIGEIYAERGDYAKGLQAYRTALKLFRENRDPIGMAMARTLTAMTYRQMGQTGRSQKVIKVLAGLSKNPNAAEWIEFYQTALSLAGKVGVRLETAPVSDILPEQVKTIQKELEKARKAGDRKDEARELKKLGVIFYALGQSTKALDYYQQALTVYQKIGDKVEQGNLLNYIGVVYSNTEQYPKALEFFQQARALRQKIYDRPDEGITLNNIGYALFLAKNAEAAEKALFEAIAIWESLRPGLTDQDKISLFEQQTLTYQLLQQVLVQQNKSEAALEIAERGRARAFAELLAQRLNGEQQADFPIPPLTIQQIRQIAKTQNATLVEYSVIGDETLYIWVVQPTGEIQFRQADLKAFLNAQRLTLSQYIKQIRFEALGVRGIRVVAKEETPQAKQKLQDLHQLLIAPIVDLLPSDAAQKVVVIPHETLFLVPFPALQAANGQYLIEHHTLVTSPSIQVLELTHRKKQELQTRNRTNDRVLIVGNPVMPDPEQLPALPGAEREARAIAQLLQTPTMTGIQATETAIKQQMPFARWIHLATHGLLDEVRGIGSAIALAPADKDDGFLRAEEILKMKLQADLVVLSACDTGRGRITGDGVIGLSRSLISAGVPSVIVSLWAVPDAPTASLMTQFYQNLQKTSNKAQALRQAMLTTLRQHPNPRDWAAFTLIGEAE